MANRLFSYIPLRRPKKNVFDLSHDVKLSLDMGQLIPIYVEDIVPGDKFRVRTEVMLRFAPMLAPIMHRVNVYTHFFFVPYRLLWKDWEDFITGGRTVTKRCKNTRPRKFRNSILSNTRRKRKKIFNNRSL